MGIAYKAPATAPKFPVKAAACTKKAADYKDGTKFVATFKTKLQAAVLKDKTVKTYMITTAKTCQDNCMMKMVPLSASTAFQANDWTAGAKAKSQTMAVQACYPGMSAVTVEKITKFYNDDGLEIQFGSIGFFPLCGIIMAVGLMLVS